MGQLTRDKLTGACKKNRKLSILSLIAGRSTSALAKMFAGYFPLVFLILTGLCGIDSCEFSDCFCDDAKGLIMCGWEDEGKPHFTFMERFFAKNVHLTAKQSAFLPDICLTFASLKAVYYEGPGCPTQLTCAHLYCE